jgi:hypothetical protein
MEYVRELRKLLGQKLPSAVLEGFEPSSKPEKVDDRGLDNPARPNKAQAIKSQIDLVVRSRQKRKNRTNWSRAY